MSSYYYYRYVLQKAEKPNGTSNGTTVHKASNGHMSNGHGRSRVGFETNAYDMRGWREVAYRCRSIYLGVVVQRLSLVNCSYAQQSTEI